MKYHITHERDGIYHGILVEGPSSEIAKNFFSSSHPNSRVCGIHEATMDDWRPGKPLLIVPDGWAPAPASAKPSLNETIKQAQTKAASSAQQTPGKEVTYSMDK